MSGPADGLAIVALGCLVAAAAVDIVRYEIPDMISVVLLAAAVGYGVLTPHFGWAGHGMAMAAMFGFGLLAFARNWMGGGDVKVLVTSAAWVGLPGLIPQFLAVAIAGGGLAMVLVAARAVAVRMNFAGARMPKLLQRDAPLPYAVAIAAGTIWWACSAYPIR